MQWLTQKFRKLWVKELSIECFILWKEAQLILLTYCVFLEIIKSIITDNDKRQATLQFKIKRDFHKHLEYNCCLKLGLRALFPQNV